MWQELMKTRALEETMGEFVKSGRYAQLPTEAEKAEAEKEFKEAKEAELGMEDSVESTEKADNDEKETNPDRAADNDGKEVNEDRAADNGGKEANAGRTPEGIPGDIKKDASIHGSVHRNRAVLQERRMTVAEAETTPEALKVKRAKARAAYRANQAEIPERVMDLKH